MGWIAHNPVVRNLNVCNRGRVQTDHQLDQQLCFALYSAARTAMAGYREELTAMGLTYTQYVALLALLEEDGRTVSQLGAALHLDSGTLSPLLSRMVGADLIERRREGSDGRVVTIHLTQAGRELEPRVCAMQQRLYESLDMDTDELATLRRLARRFSEAATPHPDEGAPR